jgi:transposase
MRMRAMNGLVSSKPTQRRYSQELKERAVRMVLQLREETGERHGSVKRVADQLDIGMESLRSWVHQHEIDHGARPGVRSGDAARIKELEQEVKELRRANTILKQASAFFAAELDRPQR